MQCFAGSTGDEINPTTFASAASASARDVLLFGLHTPVEEFDAQLIKWRVDQLHGSRSVLWVLLLHTPGLLGPARQHGPPFAQATGAGVCTWEVQGLMRRYHFLAHALNASYGYARETDPHLKLYYWLHASVVLWNETLGHAHPKARWLWRLEPDVLFAGSLSHLIKATTFDTADLLLHKFVRFATDEDEYYHWNNHPLIVHRVGPARRYHSLVSAGRYSHAFLRMIMHRYWSRGMTAYEEILLPVACATGGTGGSGDRRRADCEMAGFSSGGGIRHLDLATHFRFRPEYPCHAFLEAYNNSENELWHPVKDRACVAQQLQLPPLKRLISP